MDVTNPRSHPLLEHGLSKKAIVKSIQERRDEYHITIATLLGCELRHYPIGDYYRYSCGGGVWSSLYSRAAYAARAWLVANNHDLNGWQEDRRNDEARTHGEESNPAGN